MIDALHKYLLYLSQVGVIHEWHSTLNWVMSFLPKQGMHYLGSFMTDQLAEGQRQRPKGSLEKDQSKSTDDFLTKLLRMNALQPDKFTMEDVYSICMTNIGAGSDTTSVSLAGIMYCFMKNPEALEKVRAERLRHRSSLTKSRSGKRSTKQCKVAGPTRCSASKKRRSCHTSRRVSRRDYVCIPLPVCPWFEWYLRAGRPSQDDISRQRCVIA